MHSLWAWIKDNLDKIGAVITVLGGIATFVSGMKKKWAWLTLFAGAVTVFGSIFSLFAGFSSSRSQASFQAQVEKSQKDILTNAGTIDGKVKDAQLALGHLQDSLKNENQAVGKLTGTVHSGTTRVLEQLQRASQIRFTKNDGFTVELPFVKSDIENEIAVFSTDSDTRLTTSYARMNGLATAPTDPRLLTPFLARVLQNCILQLLFDAETPMKTFDASRQTGFITHIAPPILVPDAAEYSKADLLSLIQTLNLKNDSPIPWDTWLPQKLQLPHGTQVQFTNPTGPQKGASYSVILKRPPEYSVVFTITPAGIAEGFLPPHFIPAPTSPRHPRRFSTYSFAVYETFTWNGDRDKGQEYSDWAGEVTRAVKTDLAAELH